MQFIFQKTLEDTLYYNNIPTLIYKINYPFFITSCSTTSAQKINKHYADNSRKIEKYCRTVLYPQAVESTKYRQTNQPPFYSYTLEVDFNITYNIGCITSLYMDTYTYMGGAHGETVRTSDTWDFNTGLKLQLDNIYPLSPTSLYKLQKNIEQQISDRLLKEPSTYFENYSSLLRKTFQSNNFYLILEGFVIYYQQYDITPYATGLPEFLIPF